MEILVIILVAAAALAVVLVPIVRARTVSPEDSEAAGGAFEREIARYRTALRAGTVCGRCYRANPDGSRFCAECGRAL